MKNIFWFSVLSENYYYGTMLFAVFLEPKSPKNWRKNYLVISIIIQIIGFWASTLAKFNFQYHTISFSIQRTCLSEKKVWNGYFIVFYLCNCLNFVSLLIGRRNDKGSIWKKEETLLAKNTDWSLVMTSGRWHANSHLHQRLCII